MQGLAKENTLAENRTGADGCRSEPGLHNRTEEDIDLLPRLSSNHPRIKPKFRTYKPSGDDADPEGVHRTESANRCLCML